MPKDNEVDEKAVAFAMTDHQDDGPMTILTTDRKYAECWAAEGIQVEPLYSSATVAELRAEVAYYKENFQSCMTTLNAINDAITEADEDGRGFVPVNQLENILTGADPT